MSGRQQLRCRVGNLLFGFSSESLVFCHRREQIAPVDLYKERHSEERREGLALGHKRGKRSEKHKKKTNFLERIAGFLRAICSNHENLKCLNFICLK